MWYHLSCFTVPRKFTSGPDQMSVEDFCRDILVDQSDILLNQCDEVVEALSATKKAGKAATPAAAKRKKGDAGGEDTTESGFLQLIKARYDATTADGGVEEPPTKKKSKTTKVDSQVKAAGGGGEEAAAKQLEAYGLYGNATGIHLKDVLSWNKQYKTGTKDFVLIKCIDGFVYGRLARCSLCGGQLKLLENGTTVKCNGRFDEDLHVRLDCAFTCKAAEAPRFQPWYDRPPTDEEVAEMERLIEAAKGEDGGGGGEAESEDVKKLVKAASKKLSTWNLTSKEGINAATMGLIGIFRSHAGKTVDIPADDSAARKAVGPTLVAHKNLSAAEMVPVVIKAFGFVEDKADKAAKKQAAISSSIKHQGNAALVAAFNEMGQLYVKQGEAFKGNSFNKVANALAHLDFEVTEENAMGLSKKPNKVEGIGKSSAEKMLEFVTSGKIEKLEEMRRMHK